MSFSTTRRGSLPFILPSGPSGPSSSSLHTTPGSVSYSPHKTPSPGGTPMAAVGQHRLPTTSPPSERLRRLAPKPVMIPSTPPIPLVLGGALRRGSRGKVLSVKELKEAREGREGSKGKGRVGSEARAERDKDTGGAQEGEGRGIEAEDGHGAFGLGISGFTFGDGPPRGPARVEHDGDIESDLDGFDFAPLVGAATYDPERASRENSYVSYEDRNHASFSTTSSFGFDTFSSPDDLSGTDEIEPYEYGIASPRSVDARRRAPDVPEEVKYARTSLHRSIRRSQPLSGGTVGVNGLLSASSGSGSGGDEIDSFFLDMRPAARQGDELLSPQTYLANHTPRAVLVQFRDVFGGGDTIAPHLPTVHMPGGPEDKYSFPARARPQEGDSGASIGAVSVAMDRVAPLASSFSETFGVGRTATCDASDDPMETLDRPSMDMDSLRAPSRADSASSFSFSAYMRSENGDAEADSIWPRVSQEQTRQRSVSLRRRSKYVDRLVPDLTFGDSPAMEDLVTPETRTDRLTSDATDFDSAASHRLDGAEVGEGVGLVLGLHMDDPPSPTPHSGRSAPSRLKTGKSPQEAAMGRKPLQITLNRPSMTALSSNLGPSPGELPEHLLRGKSGTQRPTTSAVHSAPKPRHHKSFPNLAKRPFTAPYHAQTFQQQQQHPVPEVVPALVASTSHTSLSLSEKRATLRKSKSKAASKIRPDPLSAKSVAAAQEAKEGKPFEEFRVDGFGAGPKDSRWKGNLKTDAQIGGLTVGRYTTINLWADQHARESISTLYPVRLHTPARAKQLDAEIGGGPQVVPVTKGKKDAQVSPSANASDAFYRDGCVEFGMDPRGRDKWMFKHGSLEGLPKMSRLTINGSQNLDYLSRHISLQIRETGIYTVRGSEKEGAEWRMRYMVNKAPPCLRPEDRCIVIMAFYVNGPFLRGLHASKVGLATSFAKSFKPDIHAVKASTPELIQASQVPTLPEVRLDPVDDAPQAECDVATSPACALPGREDAQQPDSRAVQTPVSISRLPRRSTSIKRAGIAAVTPSTPLRQQHLGQKPPNLGARRPSTANPSIPHGTPRGHIMASSPVATPPLATKGKESLMASVRKRAATVWTRPSTGAGAISPPSRASPVSSKSPSVKGAVGLEASTLSTDPPSSAASGASFGSAIGNLLKSKRSLANLKRAPAFAMSPALPANFTPTNSNSKSEIPRVPLSAKSANYVGTRGGLTPSASAQFASQQPLAGHGVRHMRTFSANAAPGVNVDPRVLGPQQAERVAMANKQGSDREWTFGRKQSDLAADGAAMEMHTRTLGRPRMGPRPPMSGAHRHSPIGARRRPSTANDASFRVPPDGQRDRYLQVDAQAEDVLRVRGGSSAIYLSPYDRQRFERR